MFQESVSYSAALIAGLLSFFSPCVLPLIPAYFTFITGFSLDELTHEPDGETRKKVLFSTIVYVLGFSTVFIAMGASASFLGGFLFKFMDQIRIVGGVIILLLGIHLTGLFRFGWLDFEKRIHVQKKTTSLPRHLYRRHGFRGRMEPLHRPPARLYPHHCW